jgi:hypothetical protein
MVMSALIALPPDFKVSMVLACDLQDENYTETLPTTSNMVGSVTRSSTMRLLRFSLLSLAFLFFELSSLGKDNHKPVQQIGVLVI